MGLSFQVGTTANVFTQPFATEAQREIQLQLQYSVPEVTSFGGEAYTSEELGWSGWKKLQDLAVSVLGEENVPQLLAMEAWVGVYLPLDIEPAEVTFANSTPLQCGGLSALVRELQHLSRAHGLPMDNEGLRQLWHKYMEDDDLIDEDMEIQTYIQLMLTAQVAIENDLPLWVVK